MLSMGMKLPMKRIVYTVQFTDRCENPIKKLIVKYDGEALEPGGEMNLSHIGGASLTMPMIIPKIATVSWEEEDGAAHQYNVPLKSLIKTKDIIGSKFKIIYSVCDADLQVIFGKKVGQFEYEKKEIWSSKKLK